MTNADDLLAAVRADPFDDGPRLVAADWYEENRQPERAEFIRLQIANDNNPEVGFTWRPEWPGADLPGCEFRHLFVR